MMLSSPAAAAGASPDRRRHHLAGALGGAARRGRGARRHRGSPSKTMGLLGRPRVRSRGEEAVTVAYPAVAWSAGTHTVWCRGPVVIRADGVTDSMPSEPRTIVVASVLPAGQPADRLPVQPEAGMVEERVRTPWPVLVALLLAGALFAPVAWWWRRRGASRRAGAPGTRVGVAPAGGVGGGRRIARGGGRGGAGASCHDRRAKVPGIAPGRGDGAADPGRGRAATRLARGGYRPGTAGARGGPVRQWPRLETWPAWLNGPAICAAGWRARHELRPALAAAAAAAAGSVVVVAARAAVRRARPSAICGSEPGEGARRGSGACRCGVAGLPTLPGSWPRRDRGSAARRSK